MGQQLSLASRPKTLDQLIGQEKLVAAVRGMVQQVKEQEAMPKAWLFSGPTGCGKTTIARIIALSYQCQHQDGEWGKPCRECQARYTDYNIHEINGSEITGKEAISRALEGSDYAPFAGSAYRVYIEDECQRMSPAGQSLSLKYLEDSPDTTIFILCTTHPQNIIETLRGRCKAFSLRELTNDAILQHVRRLLKRVKSDLPADRLADALAERNVRYPRLICHAVERYVGGSLPEEAAVVDVVQEVDTRSLTRAMIKGDWEDVSRWLVNAQNVDARSIRAGVISYLKAILLESPEIAATTKAVAKSLEAICGLQNADDLTVSAALASQLYQLCDVFSKYPR